MAVSTITKVYGVDDFKIFPILQDDKEEFSCGSEIDCVGVKQVSITFEAEEKDLTGDEMTLDTMSKVKAVTVSTELAKLNLEAMELFTGGTLTTTEDGATLSIGSNASGNQKYFQAQFQIKSTDNDGGDLHYIVYKAKATSTPINGTEDDFATFTVDLKGVYTNYAGFSAGDDTTEQKLVDIKINKTKTNLKAVTSTMV